jgi:hypothetical protein
MVGADTWAWDDAKTWNGRTRNGSYQGDPTMRPRRVRFTIRGLMIAVLVVAVLLSMAIRELILLILCTTVLAIMFFCAYRLAITTNGWREDSRVGRGRNLQGVLHSGADISTPRSSNVRLSRNNLTLIDLMATVAAAALGMGFLVWVAPPPPGVPAVIVVFWLIVPLVGILWDRWRGCTGILGGVLGGAAEAGFALIMLVTGPHGPGWPVEVVIMTAAFLTFGTLTGVAAWLAAAMMGRSVAPTSPSPNDRFVRQR